MRTQSLTTRTFLAAVLVAGGLGGASQTPLRAGAPSSETKSVPGNDACRSCHSEIYNSYVNTVMAKASGLANDGLITGEFTHKPSRVHYRVYQQDGRVWMSYERESEEGFRGQRELLYFIGSGVKGRTYLFSVDGFLFEAPINWYAQEGRWNMTPAYTESLEIPMNLPAFPSCLNCHTSGMQAPVAGTESKFSGKPFAHDGITCERCHGSGEGHGGPKAAGPVSVVGNSSIVNPANLPPEQRDAVCMECHFEGTVAVEQPGKHLYEFQPGDRLSDYVHYFLLSGNQPETARGLSQFEALSLSACKRKSADRMWCGSCHDPHREPAKSEKAAYYRSRCLACHGEQFAATHHADKPDCTACHMPQLPSKDVAHTETTDHRILRYPKTPPLPRLQVRGTPGAPLVSFPESAAPLATTRDFALAWETLAQRNMEDAARKAEMYLRMAVTERPEDSALLASLGFADQEEGDETDALELYEHALKLDPLDNDAAANLGILEARTGKLQRAVELWQAAFQRVPHRSALGVNLAMVFCAARQKEDARRYVKRVLEFNPDYGKAKSLLLHLDANPAQCKP